MIIAPNVANGWVKGCGIVDVYESGIVSNCCDIASESEGNAGNHAVCVVICFVLLKGHNNAGWADFSVPALAKEMC